MASLKAYAAVTAAEIKTVVHFRANLIAWIFFTPLKLGVLYLVWRIIFQDTDEVGGLNFSQMMIYYVIVTYLSRLLDPIMVVNYQVWEDINQGKLDIYLARPLSYGLFVFARSLGTPILELLMGLPFMIGFALILQLPVQTDPLLLIMFAVSVFCACLLMFLIQFLIGSLTFWVERIFGFRDVIFSVFMLLSGQLIPLTALPDWVQTLSRYLPFGGIISMPASIFMADERTSAFFFLARQLLWCSVLLFMATTVWSRGVPRYASQGG